MVNLSGNSTCDIQQPECSLSGLLTDGHTGIMRLGDDHRDAFFDVNPTFGDLATGCPTWGGVIPVDPRFDSLEFIVDTGDDDLDSDANLEAYIYGPDNNFGHVLEHGPIHSGGSLLFDDQSEWGVIYTFEEPRALTDIQSIFLTMSSTATFSEEWHAQAISVYAINSLTPWLRTCVARSFQGSTGSPAFIFNVPNAPSQTLNAGTTGVPCR